MISEETKQRIEREAEAFAKKISNSFDVQWYIKKYFIAGATLYASRIEELERENRELKERGEKMAITLQIIHDIKDFTDKEGFVQQLCKSALKEK